jgi:hypothetical protein
MVDVRPSSMSSPSTCWKIRYNSRSDTRRSCPAAGDHRSLLVSGSVQHYGTPQVLDVIATLDFDQKQTLLRVVVEEVHVMDASAITSIGP